MRKYLIALLALVAALPVPGRPNPPAQEQNKVRLSKITVDPARVTEYNALLKEEIEASMRLEPGVLTLYAVTERNVPKS